MQIYISIWFFGAFGPIIFAVTSVSAPFSPPSDALFRTDDTPKRTGEATVSAVPPPSFGTVSTDR